MKFLTKKFPVKKMLLAFAVLLSCIATYLFLGVTPASASTYYETDATYQQYVSSVDTRSSWTKFWDSIFGGSPQLEPIITQQSQHAGNNHWRLDRTMNLTYGGSNTTYQNQSGDYRQKVTYTDQYVMKVYYDVDDWYSVTITDLSIAVPHTKGRENVNITCTNSTSYTVTFSMTSAKSAGAKVGIGDFATLSANKSFSSTYSNSRTTSNSISMSVTLAAEAPSGNYEAELHQQFQKYKLVITRQKIVTEQRKEGWWIFKSWKDKKEISNQYVEDTSAKLKTTELYLALGNTTFVWHDEIHHFYYDVNK